MNAKVNQRIIRGSYELPQDVPLSRECQDMLSRIFVTEPKRRIKAPQMKQHPWLAGVLRLAISLTSWLPDRTCLVRA